MPVVRIDALCVCEGCGSRFGVEVDTATDLTGETIFQDVVLETIRGGTAGYTWGVRGKATVDRFPLSYQPTIQGEMLLCGDCSKKCDEVPIEGNLTKEQVFEALGLIEI